MLPKADQRTSESNEPAKWRQKKTAKYELRVVTCRTLTVLQVEYRNKVQALYKELVVIYVEHTDLCCRDNFFGKK